MFRVVNLHAFAFLLILSPIFNQACLFAQTNSTSGQGFFLEIGGAAPIYSVNYTRNIYSGSITSSYVRVGVSIWKNSVAFPVGFTFLTGNGDHHAEISFALTPYSEGYRFWSRSDSDIMLDLALGMAYRYQPPSRYYFFAAGLFPYIRLDPTPSQLSSQEVSLRLRPALSVGKFLR